MLDLSSPIRERAHTPCIGRQSLHHWITRETLGQRLLKSNWLYCKGALSPVCCSVCRSWRVLFLEGLDPRAPLLTTAVFLPKINFPGGSDDKESACNVGHLGSIRGWRRSLGEGNDRPLQYSCLENPMDGGAWQATVHGVTKSRTWLSDFTSLEARPHLCLSNPCLITPYWSMGVVAQMWTGWG